MLAVFDLPTVQRFAAELDTRRTGCNGEGMFCSDLDETLGCHDAVCQELLDAVKLWAHEVFSGRVAFDPEVESVFQTQLEQALDSARPLTKNARDVRAECFQLDRLDSLETHLDEIQFLLRNWASPGKSVAPAPRVPLHGASESTIKSRLSQLSPLPEGWQPVDSRQRRMFRHRPAS